MIYVIFTYRDDAAALTQCLRGISAVDPLAKIAIFDDSENPLPCPPEQCYYSQTNFHRGGNLNGIKCVAGILRSFLAAMDFYNEEAIVKIDSDIILLHPPKFKKETEYGGSEGRYWGFAAGAYYYTTRNVSQASLDYIRGRDWVENSKFPEDETIGRLATMQTNNWEIFTERDDRLRGIGEISSEHLKFQAEWGSSETSIALHFGQMRIPDLAGLPRPHARFKVAKAMEDFLSIYYLTHVNRPLS
ncbi:MAG: hypothetical protein RR553_09790 [Akkermansia sp.]